MHDNINHPKHYTEGKKFEPIDVIEDWNLGFHLGNTIKYISRAGLKDPNKTIEDLEKAEFYLKRYINNLKEKKMINGSSEYKSLGASPENKMVKFSTSDSVKTAPKDEKAVELVIKAEPKIDIKTETKENDKPKE